MCNLFGAKQTFFSLRQKQVTLNIQVKKLYNGQSKVIELIACYTLIAM